MSSSPVIRNYSSCLVHVPDLVRYGSKPQREIGKDPGVSDAIRRSLRTFEEAVRYPPNQTFVGNMTPEELRDVPRPWYEGETGHDVMRGRFGEILDQSSFYGLLKAADVLNPPLFSLENSAREKMVGQLTEHPLLHGFAADVESGAEGTLNPSGLPIHSGEELIGRFGGDERAEGQGDENLQAHILLENLCSKASGALALTWLLHREGAGAESIDFLISCGEEGCGDRYQRGGGGMAKAIGEMCGCINASGMDIKNFCAAPISAIITAAAMVQAGLHKRVVVVGGGSLAKLGMKFQSFLSHKIPILDDCLGCMAVLVSENDGTSPMIRLEAGAVGRVPIDAGNSDEAVFRHYLLRPLEALGLQCTDIDRYGVELQNPEIMEFAGSGDVAAKNYRKIGAMGVMAGQLAKEELSSWIERVGMVGFAPTQGHIPSAVPYIGHALEAMDKGEIKRAMFLARASLFLNRCTSLLDGASFVLERNPQQAENFTQTSNVTSS